MKNNQIDILETKIKRQRETKKMYKRLAKKRRIYAGHLGEVLRKRNLKIKELKENEIVIAEGELEEILSIAIKGKHIFTIILNNSTNYLEKDNELYKGKNIILTAGVVKDE